MTWIIIHTIYLCRKKSLPLNSVFDKIACVMNAFITDKTKICKVCFISMALIRGWGKCKGFPFLLYVVVFKILPSGHTVYAIGDNYKDIVMVRRNINSEKDYSRGCSEGYCKKQELLVLSNEVRETQQRGELPSTARSLSRISLEGEKRKKHPRLEGQFRQIILTWWHQNE